MDKKQLRTVIEGLHPSQVIHIAFRNGKAHLTRDWTVIKTKTGKGKGGSKLVELIDSVKNTITTGTPDSDDILNITVAGVTTGFESESQVPPVYEKDVTMAATLRENFKRLIGTNSLEKVSVKLTSTVAPEFNGTFKVKSVKQLAGRHGQVKLTVADVKGTEFEIWSYRHSGAIQSCEIVHADDLSV